MRIVSHRPPRHLDDSLAIALLLTKYPDAEIEFLHPQRVPEDYLKDPQTILIDIGGNFNPELKNYDHHQDLNLPFSFLMVLEHEFPQYYEVLKEDERLQKEVLFFDLKDRFGIKEASARIPGVGTSILQERIILKLSETLEGLKTIGQILRDFFEEKLAIKNAMENLIEFEIRGIPIAIDKTGVRAGEIFARKQIAILVQPNSQDPNHTSIIRNSYYPDIENLVDLKRIPDPIFVHPNGFIAVIPFSIDDRENVEKIIRKVLKQSFDKKSDLHDCHECYECEPHEWC